MTSRSLFSFALAPVFLSLVALAPGCTSDGGEPASPALTAAPAPTPLAEAPVARRTVSVRNPFGNTQVEGNLMADGDFELTGRYDQQPWLAFGSQGQSILNFETGGRCRSGVRCLVLTPGETVIGWLAMPKEGKVTISVWAKPEADSCKDLAVHVVDVDHERNSTNLPTPPLDENGSCHFEGSVDVIAFGAPAVWLEVDQASKTKRIVVDDVVALPMVPGASSTRGLDLSPRAAAPTRLPFVADYIRRHRRFGLPPKTGPENPPPTRNQLLRAR